ncbi:MAG: hypothetical protein IT267_07340 [Saprospiraceae bacterium]|nr:hypothetical protein [Saprospiraceae bacterium]
MILSENIDLLVEDFEKNPEKFDKALEKIEADNVVLFDILLGSHAEVLNDDEMDFLVFLFVIIYSSADKQYQITCYNEQDIEKEDDKSWEVINTIKDFVLCYDHFETESSEKELMDFILISIEEDDENEYNITTEGRMVMLSVLVTLVKLISKDKTIEN